LTAFLSQESAVPAAVASNAEPANLNFVLDGTGLRWRFQVVVDGHQVTRPKPDPEIFLRAAALLQFEPRQCIVFEDSAPGIQAARAAGMRVVAVNTARATLPPADLTVDDFSAPELPAWLARSC
jgi:HAD superfamily hydrolase (TIGR01509 family)